MAVQLIIATRSRFRSSVHRSVAGYVAKDTVGTNGFNFVHPDDRSHLLIIFAELLENPGGSRSAQMRVRHHDGSWHSLEAVATNLLHDSAVTGIVVSCRDVTELETTTRVLQEANNEVEQQRSVLQQRLEWQQRWVSDVTHELKNPLATMRARLEIAVLHPDQTDWQVLMSEVRWR